MKIVTSQPAGRQVVRLGKAKLLTKASFIGTKNELNPDRVYSLGG